MKNHIYRLFVEKKPNFDVEGKKLLQDLRTHLEMKGLKEVRILNRYDIQGMEEEAYKSALYTIFSEPTVDEVYEETLCVELEDQVFAVEYLPGQYDQRADSAAQCVQMLTQGEKPKVATAKVIVLKGEISEAEVQKVKEYCINPVDSREASLEKPSTLEERQEAPKEVAVLDGFIEMEAQELEKFMENQGLAMTLEDLKFCRDYFKNTEHRNPTITEIKVIDTYWSDHCRHTTFQTNITEVEMEKGKYSAPIEKAYESYLASRAYVYAGKEKAVCLMDIAVLGMKELRKRGKLQDLDVSEEINACSIVVDAKIDGNTEKWLVMFKNETHNHPTEIEPFGGAATCLGGAIRDPLSGRSYVYQAMRVTGSGDPRTRIQDTLKGKLPQRKITLEAAHGYSSYGNQIGLATGQVTEVYEEDFVAKRMEIGAVIAAAPYENVVREKPNAEDVIILLGGRTGRDGCGGATGSSKEHQEDSILTCGAEVQKGNPPTERKIQRLFRNPKVTRMIKRCNDFGAGGVSVAIGELTEGLEINLDSVPKKYEGLDGTELAISESQERMAVVVAEKEAASFIQYAEEENLEAVVVAKVTADRRLKMEWRGKTIVDLSRDFLDTNGVTQYATVKITAPKEETVYFEAAKKKPEEKKIKETWLAHLQDLNICSQKGLVERFDSTIGAGTVLLPFGGKYQLTPAEVMVAKLPVLKGETSTGTIMSHGYNAKLAKWSPFHGAVYAIVESVTKIVAAGGKVDSIRLTLQEYFEKLGKDPQKWGKPFSALLGAFYAQKQLGIAAIGGKDSMSGTFKEMNVPPTLVSFAVDVVEVEKVISPEFKGKNHKVILLSTPMTEEALPDFEVLKQNFDFVHQWIGEGKVLSAHTVKLGGIAEAISKMSFGNKLGFAFVEEMDVEEIFTPAYGSMVLELKEDMDLTQVLSNPNVRVLGETQEAPMFIIKGEEISLEEALMAWTGALEEVFKTTLKKEEKEICNEVYHAAERKAPAIKVAKPRVFIPVFPGTNCEYDSARAFEKAGAEVTTFVVKNLSPAQIEASLKDMAKAIDQSQIIMLPGGFSAGDEPDGSGKFIATAFRNVRVKEAVQRLLQQRDGLMLGICNGFQALIKLGLVPYGDITEITEESPTLTYNEIGRHVSCMVQTKIVSNQSPWFQQVKVGDIHTIPVSHGEGRFMVKEAVAKKLFENGQVATQYVDFEGNPTYDISFNPNGSMYAIEGITSIDGRILGKMGHSERVGHQVGKNILGEKDQKLFQAGVNYFK